MAGNYYFFELFIELKIDGAIYLGYPKRPIRDVGTTPPVICWATPLKLSFPDPAIPRVSWIDDAQNGLSKRTMNSPEDLLSAQGLIGGRKYRFEQILQQTKGQVVYSLICDEDETRIAYAFSRELFSVEKALGIDEIEAQKGRFG